MGYTTIFKGQLAIHPLLNAKHLAYLKAFNTTRHMKWNVDEIAKVPDPVREAVHLPLGSEGAFVVLDVPYQSPLVTNPNHSPNSLPGLWCSWTPTDNGQALKWDGGDNFSFYQDWLSFLFLEFLRPWGYRLEG